ncbi:hypothetical protein F2Q70_00029183 [Brassica cretica]|uniref:Uncharacterized protein n=1 Tax=Brassica cretica TaxID=69181 RepID=A0A8S9FMA3_BRACR|nr:hypothetical protein F2Q70_00029183 [Brassica cretica]
MSSSHGDKRSSDVEMGEATSPAPIPTSPVEAPACVADHLSFREKLVRRQAEKEQVRAGAELPSSSARYGSWDRGRNSARYGNSRRLGRSGCFGFTCWIVHDSDSRRR